MTSRKTAADNEGWRKGQGAYSKTVELKRGSFPTSNPGTDKRGHGKYTDDRQTTTRVKENDRPFTDPERLTNDAAKDIFDAVEENCGPSGVIKGV